MSRAPAVAIATNGWQWSTLLELLKPITWFPPMWAFACGIVSSGAALNQRWGLALAGAALAGPLVCGTSQVVNDWFDRHVDAINEPHRPIPSGRAPGRIALYFAIAWSALSLGAGVLLGPWVAIATLVGLGLAWAYSAPPLRLKKNGWTGNAAVAICYEGLPWFTAVAAVTSALPDYRIILLAALYSLGAHGIMTLNDFKSMRGDRVMGVQTIPVQLGPGAAARLACVVMAAPQISVVALLLSWRQPVAALIISGLLLAQGGLMWRFLQDPRRYATWYSGFGVTLYVLGMLVSAVALRSVVA